MGKGHGRGVILGWTEKEKGRRPSFDICIQNLTDKMNPISEMISNKRVGLVLIPNGCSVAEHLAAFLNQRFSVTISIVDGQTDCIFEELPCFNRLNPNFWGQIILFHVSIYILCFIIPLFEFPHKITLLF